jgi:hypothetical protein
MALGLATRSMKQFRRRISEKVLLLIIAPVALLGIVLLIPVVPFLLLYAYISDKQFEKGYKQFLARMNGACFFCYNSRKSSVEFARNVIVPELPTPVHVVFVNGRDVDFGADSKYISKMLYSIEERKGFPFLLKIEGGEVRYLSLNNQFYSIIIGHKSVVPLLQRIASFFNDTAPHSAN